MQARDPESAISTASASVEGGQKNHADLVELRDQLSASMRQITSEQVRVPVRIPIT